MDWERINIWTNTLYTIIHSLQIAKHAQFAELSAVNDHIIDAENWITPECSYRSALLDHPFGEMKIEFRRDPNKHFGEISSQVVKMLIQDLTVILDEMMAESLVAHGDPPLNYPQQKIEKLATYLDKEKFKWASVGCLELVAVRNVLTHAKGRWNQKSIEIINGHIAPMPKPGDRLVVGVPMLFRYRKAMRTFLNETKANT